jgi:hypothetical protein
MRSAICAISGSLGKISPRGRNVARFLVVLNERLAGLIPPTGNDYFRALLGEGEGGGAPDAGQSACDQYDWVAHFRVSS